MFLPALGAHLVGLLLFYWSPGALSLTPPEIVQATRGHARVDAWSIRALASLKYMPAISAIKHNLTATCPALPLTFYFYRQCQQSITMLSILITSERPASKRPMTFDHLPVFKLPTPPNHGHHTTLKQLRGGSSTAW